MPRAIEETAHLAVSAHSDPYASTIFFHLTLARIWNELLTAPTILGVVNRTEARLRAPIPGRPKPLEADHYIPKLAEQVRNLEINTARPIEVRHYLNES